MAPKLTVDGLKTDRFSEPEFKAVHWIKSHALSHWAGGHPGETKTGERLHGYLWCPNPILKPLRTDTVEWRLGTKKVLSKDQIKILHCSFAEIDEVPLADQPALIVALVLAGMPCPSGVVYSGGKSFHLFWVYDVDVSTKRLKEWVTVQRALIQVLGADDKVKNPAWRMRYGCNQTNQAGPFKHQKLEEGKPRRDQRVAYVGEPVSFEALLAWANTIEIPESTTSKAKAVHVVDTSDEWQAILADGRERQSYCPFCGSTSSRVLAYNEVNGTAWCHSEQRLHRAGTAAAEPMTEAEWEELLGASVGAEVGAGVSSDLEARGSGGKTKPSNKDSLAGLLFQEDLTASKSAEPQASTSATEHAYEPPRGNRVLGASVGAEVGTGVSSDLEASGLGGKSKPANNNNSLAGLLFQEDLTASKSAEPQASTSATEHAYEPPRGNRVREKAREFFEARLMVDRPPHADPDSWLLFGDEDPLSGHEATARMAETFHTEGPGWTSIKAVLCRSGADVITARPTKDGGEVTSLKDPCWSYQCKECGPARRDALRSAIQAYAWSISAGDRWASMLVDFKDADKDGDKFRRIVRKMEERTSQFRTFGIAASPGKTTYMMMWTAAVGDETWAPMISFLASRGIDRTNGGRPEKDALLLAESIDLDAWTAAAKDGECRSVRMLRGTTDTMKLIVELMRFLTGEGRKGLVRPTAKKPYTECITRRLRHGTTRKQAIGSVGERLRRKHIDYHEEEGTLVVETSPVSIVLEMFEDGTLQGASGGHSRHAKLEDLENGLGLS